MHVSFAVFCMNLKMNTLNAFYFAKFSPYSTNTKSRKDDNSTKKHEIRVFMGPHKGSKGLIFWSVLLLSDAKFQIKVRKNNFTVARLQ